MQEDPLGGALDQLLSPTHIALVNDDVSELGLVEVDDTTAVVLDELRKLGESSKSKSISLR